MPRISPFLGNCKQKIQFCTGFLEANFESLAYAYRYALSEGKHHNGIDRETVVDFWIRTCGVKKIKPDLIIREFEEVTKIVLINILRDEGKGGDDKNPGKGRKVSRSRG